MKQKYLLAYNLLLTVGWAFFFIREIALGFPMNATSLLLLNICQGAAALEILHAALKWVSSPVFTTFIQVFSRIFVLVWINLLPKDALIEICGVNGVVLVTIAWSITEIIRYSYYFFTLLQKEIYPLTYLRYTLFIVLYPLGVTGEWLILLSIMKQHGWALNPMNIFIGVILLTYLPFFPKLYLYMWKQRKKKVA
jgi:very-long-chain (3R)-3-hydroxyacyl-CoA dehydratase